MSRVLCNQRGDTSKRDVPISRAESCRNGEVNTFANFDRADPPTGQGAVAARSRDRTTCTRLSRVTSPFTNSETTQLMTDVNIRKETAPRSAHEAGQR
jgi:hypothetical protein